MRTFVFLAGGLALAGLLSMPLAADAATKKKPAASGQSQQQSSSSNGQQYWTDRHAPVN